MAKLALVLGGGGSKGAYQIGAWKALRELGISFDLVVGTSIGALNGALMAQGSYERAVELWESIEYSKIFAGDRAEEIEKVRTTADLIRYTIGGVVREGPLDASPLQERIVEYLDEEALRASPVDFGLVTVEFPTLKPVTLTKNDVPAGKMADFLMASASCFPVFPPKAIDGVRYVDGGYHDNLPVKMALGLGAESILAIDLDGIGIVHRPPDSLEIPYTRVRSHWDLGSCFCFDQNKFRRNRILGYLDTMKALRRLEGHLYAFQKGESGRNYAAYGDHIGEIRARIGEMLRRPAAKTVQAVDRKTTIGLLRAGDWDKDGPLKLCVLAELAGMVYELSPEKIYTFEEFNRSLVHEYAKYAGKPYNDGKNVDIAHVLASISQAVDRKRITAVIAEFLFSGEKENEAFWLVAEFLPVEFAAASYLKLLGRKAPVA